MSLLEQLLAGEQKMPRPPETSYDSPFLRMLVSIDRAQLTQSIEEKACGPGEIIFHEGEVGDTMYIIWSGRVVIVKGNLNNPTILSYKGVGEIIGEMALLGNQTRSASVIALDQLRLLGITRARLQRLLLENPSVSLGIMETLSDRLREANVLRSTGELSEKRLIRQVSALQSEKQRLEDLQRLRQETSELIIHDLRNPLNAIATSLKMLAFTLPENILRANQEILDVAQVNCASMQRLVDSMLEVARMEAGETQFIKSEVDLPVLIQEVVNRVSILERREIDLQTRLQKNLPHVVGDRDKIERVIVNLLDNALKYSPDNGRITITVAAHDGQAQVSLTDTGPGVPPEDRERIFERFAQSAEEKTRRRGFGLGLAYCRLAVQGHNGRIWVEPGDGGVGSRFVFTLPLVLK